MVHSLKMGRYKFLPPLEHFVLEMNKLNSKRKEGKYLIQKIIKGTDGASEPLDPKSLPPSHDSSIEL